MSLHVNPGLKTQNHIKFLPDYDITQLYIGNISEDFLKSLVLKNLLNNKKNGLVMLVDDIGLLDSYTIDLLCSVLNDKSYSNLALVYSNEPKAVRNLDYINAPYYETINLNPLSPQGLRIWMKKKFSCEPPDYFLEWLYNETMGLPGLIEYGLSYLLESGILTHNAKYGLSINKEYSNIRLNNIKQKSIINPKNICLRL
jgi:predicted ATPase